MGMPSYFSSLSMLNAKKPLPHHHDMQGKTILAFRRIVLQERLLVDSRVVDVPMASNPLVVPLSSLKPFFFKGLHSGGALLGPWWSRRPRNPIRACLVCLCNVL